MDEGGDDDEVVVREVLEAKSIYILMSKDHRISRNRRAEWFFSRFDSVFSLPKDEDIAATVDEGDDFYVVSVIPKRPPENWSPQTRHNYRYKITTRTIVAYLSRRYKIVYCIDVSPSAAAVDVQAGHVVFDGVYQALKASLDGLMRPFYIPGSTIVFRPKIFITIIAHSPFVTSINNEVIIQGKLLGSSTLNDILETAFKSLHVIENKMANMTAILLQNLREKKKQKQIAKKPPKEGTLTNRKKRVSMTANSDFSLVGLLKQALIALSLLPENSSSGLVILTDGVVSVPDGRYLDIILSQLRYNTVSCSFIQLSSPFHPHLCHGVIPYVDLMKFIATATFGAFLNEALEIKSDEITEMNVYQSSFLAWSFQASDTTFAESQQPPKAKPGEWSIRNKCFFTIRDMPIVKKQQFESLLTVDFMKVLSCRLREGFMIKSIELNDYGQYEITLTLPWKFLIHLDYVVITDKLPNSSTECILYLEGPYDFLHDVTCLASRSFPSIYRQLMVNRFWATRKNLSESDRLLVHLNSFSSNTSFYNIPDSLRNGVPLFYFSSSSTVPHLQSSDFPYQSFAQFWKVICMLDTNVWQKWMHTHRIGIILEHDHPLPKHLHFPSPAGRFQVILCRQAIMALNTLLKNSSSFVLVENHSYVTLMFGEDEKAPPFSFYIIRVTSKPPYVVLRLAFLVGTPGNLRHKTVSDLREKIAALTFPQRLKEPPRWRFLSGSSNNPDQASKTSWSELPCCILMSKPIEKILIRYDKVPENFCEVLMPQPTDDDNVINEKSTKQSTFGFKPTHPTPGTVPTVMVPEMFNTVARYMLHKRWIWCFPKCWLPDFSIKDASEILTIITKMRLQEGFRFAYSAAGTVSMVLEVQMENTTFIPTHELDSFPPLEPVKETYLTPCVLQFVMFPPTTSLIQNVEEDIDALEEPEEARDLFLITECWIEPQCGSITGSQFPLLNGLGFSDVSDKIFDVNKECILTLGAFDYLRGVPKCNTADMKNILLNVPGQSFMKENKINLLPFQFELGRVLPKCSQTEILFSMFFQDLRQAFSVEARNQFVPYHERANEIFYNSWSENLASVHDKEIIIQPKHFESLLTMVLSREDVTKTKVESKFNAEDLPAWRCFVKSINSSQQLVTLLPKSLRDTKLLFLIIEKCKCVLTASGPLSKENPPNLACTQQDSESAKLRQRKISEPNCCQKSASTGLVTHLSMDSAYPSTGRKRIRALSGGESAPVLKKAFTVDSSFHKTLTQNFFEEPASKYVVPKTKKTVVDDLNLSFSSQQDQLEGYFSESQTEEMVEQFDSAEQSGNMTGSLTMPLFMYDCSLSALRNHLIYKGTQEVTDKCQDFRIFSVLDESLKNEANDTSSISSSSTECTTPESKKPLDGLVLTPLDNYCKTLQLAYKNAFVRSIYNGLQLGYYISTEDLKASVSLCHKDIFTVDITEFLKNMCKHAEANAFCQNSVRNHGFIQRKFRDILTRKFSCTKVDTDLFFFKSPRLSQSQENILSECSHSTPISSTEIGDDDTRKDAESCRSSSQWGDVSEHFTFSDMTINSRRESELGLTEPTLPLFLLLRCRNTYGNRTKTFSISHLPVCLDDYDPNLRLQLMNSSISGKEKELNIRLELLFLTCPMNLMDEIPTHSISSAEECTNISPIQSEVLKFMIAEVEWLLNDEITSLRSESDSLTPEMLQDIALHIDKSKGKLGCFQQCIPLKFVENQTKGHAKFVEQFGNLWIPGFGLKKLDNWWYLISTAKKTVNDDGELLNIEATDLMQHNIDSLDQGGMMNALPETHELGLEERLPFWLIFRIEQNNVYLYSHCRYDEDDLITLKQCMQIRDTILRDIIRLIRIVNQDLLLQNLHDTRICSLLLEPDTSRQMPDDGMGIFSSKISDETLRSESDADTISGNIPHGTFACDVVWETTFKLHPRLRSGPGKSAFSRGMQILRSTLVAFEVGNRENMFVYRNTLGHVFYLRLYRDYENLDELIFDPPSENPSPRSSISIKSSQRKHHPSADSGNDIPLIGLRDAISASRTISEGIVLLKVHGVTEAGKEIQEELIQSLRNKLDDAVLDVLSVTLDRNPHCKLTPEDVHFIQEPYAPPDAVVRFTTGKFIKLLLPPFACYLHQNLLQFLNIPKYTRIESEFHFHDYSSRDSLPDEHNVYLYNQSPGGTGSRGVACVAVSLIDRKTEKVVRCTDWKRPWNFQFSLSATDLSTFIMTGEVSNDVQVSDIMVEISLWKQGRINLEIIKNNFISAIKHAGWDLAMEYQILTPSLFSPEALEDENILNRNKDLIMGYNVTKCSSPSIVSPFAGPPLRRRNSSAAPLGKIEDTSKSEESRERSWSYTVRRQLPSTKEVKFEQTLAPAISKQSIRGSTASTETIRSTFDFVGSRKYIVEEYSKLHPNYASKFRKWCQVGKSLNLPSMRMETIKFKPDHYLDETLEEIIKFIHAVAPDNSTAQFWKLEKNRREFLAAGRKILPEYEMLLHKINRDVASFRSNEVKLKNLERKDEATYPEELLKLFTSRDYFQPAAPPTTCVLIGRNLTHWESCVHNKKSLDSAFNSSDVIKSLYKFCPLMSEPININDDRSSLNADKAKFPTKNGLLALLGETSEESCIPSILVPRQRFLLASFTKYSVEFIFYNWSKETSDKLIEQTKALSIWSHTRWQMMSSIMFQKSGIFYHQPLFRESTVTPTNIDVKELVRSVAPIKGHSPSDRSANKNASDNRNQIGEIYRNLHHPHLLKLPDDELQSPITAHGNQLSHLLIRGRKNIESGLFRYWLKSGPSASNVIGKEAIEALRQTARTIHYCMTPLSFSPRWRIAIALTRDSSSGLFKRSKITEQDLIPGKTLSTVRHRNPSETSHKSSASTKEKQNSTIWSLWKRKQSEKNNEQEVETNAGPSRSPKKTPTDTWHIQLCHAYIQEYMQYLQTLGFIPAQGTSSAKKQNILTSDNWAQSYAGRLERSRRMSDGSVLSNSHANKSTASSSSADIQQKLSIDKEEKAYYLQKSLPGGIILLEVGFIEPFSYCQVYALEVHRIQGNKYAQRATTSHNTTAFIDECDKMKVLMHLHSFAYDFHLRYLQNHICGKQIINPCYNVTKFLDDFVNYYFKGPSFARNTVHIGTLSIQNISTPSHILFNYILTNNKKYGMNVLRMQQLASSKSVEFLDVDQGYDRVLVYTLSKRVAYRESEDESRLGEFEISLVISHDSQPRGADPSVLRIKYYIVLTSRRELYPKLAGDLSCGKLFTVTAHDPLSGSVRKESEPKRTSLDESACYPLLSESDSDAQSGNGVEIEFSTSENSRKNVIREEKVRYMGYFSSHEQVMQEILKEQTVWAEKLVKQIVEEAAVDCRRDLLWHRLQSGGKQQHAKTKTKKDELTLRETEGVLTFWEFSELLELIHNQPLRGVDPQLKLLLSQPMNFFQNLIKLLSNINNYEHRYFVAPDAKIHHLAIINPHFSKSVVLIEVNLIKQTNDLSVLFKDANDVTFDELTHELEPEILQLIETAVGACCYCNWIQSL